MKNKKMIIGMTWGIIVAFANYMAISRINMMAELKTALETWSDWWPVYLIALIIPPVICFFSARYDNSLGKILAKALLSIPINIAVFLLLAIIGAISLGFGGVLAAILIIVVIAGALGAFGDDSIIVVFFEK